MSADKIEKVNDHRDQWPWIKPKDIFQLILENIPETRVLIEKSKGHIHD